VLAGKPRDDNARIEALVGAGSRHGRSSPAACAVTSLRCDGHRAGSPCPAHLRHGARPQRSPSSACAASSVGVDPEHADRRSRSDWIVLQLEAIFAKRAAQGGHVTAA
jgi:hypothetical protein